MRCTVDAAVLALPCPTGVERALAELLSALPGALEEDDHLVVVSRDPPTVPLPDDPRIERIVTGGSMPLAAWRETRLTRAAQDSGCELVWSPVAAIPLRTDLPCVATVHETPWLVRRHLEGRLRERVHQVRLRIAARFAARIVCPSESAAQQVASLHPHAADRVRVVPHGVPERFLRPAPDGPAARARLGLNGTSPPYLLHVGGSRERKNVPLLLRAFARYRLQGGEAEVVLVGPGAAPASPPRGVRHLGYVSDEDLLALYDGALALVVSSESEGFGIPVLEAMARGTPVVAPRVGGVPEAADGAALLVQPADDRALGDALVRIGADAELRERLRDGGRTRAAAARWSDSARALLAVLREAARRP